MTGSAIAAWAESYASCGWRVFPAWGKVPAFRGWQRAASTDPDLIARWWPRDDDSNVAAVTGEAFDVFDIEREHLAALRSHVEAGKLTLPPTPIASSGGGGLHVFVAPTGINATRRLFLDGQHIGELKSRGGLVLVCPSSTERLYRWLEAPAGMALADAPDWLIALVEQSFPNEQRMPWKQVTLAPRADIAPLARHVARAELHNRNATLHWAAHRAADAGVPEDIAQQALGAAFVNTGLPAEDRQNRLREGRATIASAYRYE
jgi:hypothetical protein